jgi:hypothetical protein
MLRQEELLERVEWLVTSDSDEAKALQERLAEHNSSWASDGGEVLFKIYSRLTGTQSEMFDQAVEDAAGDTDSNKRAKVAVLFESRLRDLRRDSGARPDNEDIRLAKLVAEEAPAGTWNGTVWVPPATTTPTPPPEQLDHFPEATELAKDPDTRWHAYAGWWRRYDRASSTHLFARSNRRDATWVNQDEMVRLAATPAPAAAAPQEVYPDATELVRESDSRWHEFVGWWRRFDKASNAYLFAQSNRVDARWLDMAGMGAARSPSAPAETGLLPPTPNPLADQQKLADQLVEQLRGSDAIADLTTEELITIIDEELATS